MRKQPKPDNCYAAILESIFRSLYEEGKSDLPFSREDISPASKRLRIDLPKNLGDVIYSMRYRMKMPEFIARTAPPGKEWIIEGRGKGLYAFTLVTPTPLGPNPGLSAIKIPDATPEIVAAYALSDEQALLAKVRYNRLLDIFLGLTTYSLQNHLRTHVAEMGQIEIDEVYVGIDKSGRQYVLPIQAKGGKDRLSAVQTRQDVACCRTKFPNLRCRPISAQFVQDDRIALFELTDSDGAIRILEERHYKLVPADQITGDDLRSYWE